LIQLGDGGRLIQGHYSIARQPGVEFARPVGRRSSAITTTPPPSHTTDSDSRRRLRSASTSTLVVPPTRRMTIGDRLFPVAGARVWNALLSFVTDSATVATFKRHLKTYLFARSLS